MHNFYPLVPDERKIKRILSNYQLEIAKFLDILIGNFKKLVSNFFNKKYILHYENKQLYFRLGLNVKAIHCVLEFNQSQ